MRVTYTKVRARSANEGSGTGDWSLAPPVACFRMEDEDMSALLLIATCLVTGCRAPATPQFHETHPAAVPTMQESAASQDKLPCA